MSADVPRLGDRSLFPALEAHAYLAHAGISPPSRLVMEAVSSCLATYGRHGAAAFAVQQEHKAMVRERASQLLGCEPRQVAFVQSTSAAATTIARSIRFVRGDRVLVFEGEFPANVTPWRLTAEELDLTLVSVPLSAFQRSDEEGLALLRQELTRGVRLVAVSAVQFQTGLRMPVEAIASLCHAHGAELFVDAIQGLGVVPMNVARSEVDYLTAGGHKFLMGLEGAGLLYIRDQALAGLSLGLAGWTGHESAFDFLFAGEGHLHYDRPIVRTASFVEQGALSMVGIHALGASLQTLLSLGIDNIFAHVNHYLDQLEPQLVELGCPSVRAKESARRAATLSLRLPASKPLADVARSLAQQGVTVSTPDGYLRFAPHFANHTDELPHVVRALRDALA